MTRERTDRRRILAAGSHDSYFQTVALLANELTLHDLDIETVRLGEARTEASGSRARSIGKEELRDFPFESFDFVLICSNETWVHAITSEIDGRNIARRPKIVCLWPGLLASNTYKTFSDRLTADLLLFSDQRSYFSYQQFSQSFAGKMPESYLLGWPQCLAHSTLEAHGDRTALTFFEQTIIPESREERKFIAVSLLDLCRRHPTRTLFLKLRQQDAATTTNPAIYELPALVREAAGGALPGNLVFSEFTMTEALARSAMTLTVSSTAAIESMAAGVPCAIISDLGINERLANSYFIGSGCFRTFREVDPDEPPTVSEDWRQRHIVGVRSRVARLAELLRADNRGRDPRPRSFPAFSKEFEDFLRPRWSADQMLAGAFHHRRRHFLLKVLCYKAPLVFRLAKRILG